LRVTDRGHKSFILAARYPMHPKNSTRRALGMVGSLTVNAACDKARRWLDLISKEIDPKTEEERLRAESEAPPGRDLRAGRQRFSRSAAPSSSPRRKRFNHRDRASCRDGGIDQSKMSCRRCLAGDPVHPCPRLPRLRPAAPLQICATCSTGRLRRMNTRLLSRRSATSNRGGLIGARVVRQRILTKGKLRAVWSGAGAMGYPYEGVFKLLILTG
jgi:hypothetical protein